MKYLLMSLLGLMMSLPAFASLDAAASEVVKTEAGLNYEITLDEVQTQTEDYYVNFGRVYVGDRRNAVFTLRNRGSLPIIVQDIDIEGYGFNGGDNCPRILTRGDRCSIRVTFRPRQQGQYRGQVDIELSGHEDIRLHLRGRGVW
jgi:hypothetical protein